MLRCTRDTRSVMFTIPELEAAVQDRARARCRRRRSTPGRCCRQRTGVDVVIKHENHTPTGAFKVRGGIVYADRLKRERPHVKGVDHGDARQSRAIARLRVRARRRCLHGGRAVRQFGREERRHAGVRRRADRARARLRRGARARRVEIATRARLRIRQVVRPRSGAGRRDLRATSCSPPSRTSTPCMCRSGSAPASAA